MIHQYSTYYEFVPILIFLLVSLFIAVFFACVGKFLSTLVGSNNPNSEKNSPFECGFKEFGSARIKFDVRFYLMAVLFLIFDLEMVFMIPWSILIRNNGDISMSSEAFVSMMVFLSILLVGFIYEWKKGR